MTGLALEELLNPGVMPVQAGQRYCDVARHGDGVEVFAVFNVDQFLGLIPRSEAAQSPDGFLGANLRHIEPMPANTSAEQAIRRLRDTQDEHVPVVDDDGRFLGAVSQLSLFAAVTARCELIIRHHEIAAAVFDSTGDGIVVTDASASILLVNRAFTTATGYTLEDVRGHRPSILSSGHHGEEFYQSMWQSLRDIGTWSGEIWNRRKSGEIYPEWLRINAVRNNAGLVTHYVGVFADISSEQRLQHQLHRLAYHDALTGLPNRQLFRDRVGQAIAHARRSGRGFALLFVDFDHFKEINDSFGHSFGDRLLQAAASRIRQAVRETDTVSRLGGDEFTVLLEEAGSERYAAATAAKILQSGESGLDVDGRTVPLTASVGIARYPEDAEDIDTLLRCADTAMYQAKREGRNRYRFFTGELNEQVQMRLSMESGLRSGLRSGQFYMVWQPQVRLADGQWVGLEALARWRHPQQGDVEPGRFIRLAEESGLMPEFGCWSLNAAAAGAAVLAEACRRRPMRLGINISAAQLFETGSLRNSILQALEQSGLALSYFELELSESTLMSRGRAIEPVLGDLRSRGLQIAVDDFGTGFSRFSCLKRMAVRRVKIDGALVRNVAVDSVSRQLVAGIIGMARGLDIQVAAEGVETDEQRCILLELGCEEGQGNLFGKPTALPEIIGQFPA